LQIKSNAVGRAGVLRVTPGASVVQGTPVIDVLDDIARVVEVQVPSENILQFHEGDTVKLTFPGRLQRTGRIAAVAPQAQLLASGAAGDESFVDVRIEACGEQWPEVPAGSRVVVRLPSSFWSL
jgi:multidrug resistance efflux pump